MNINYTYKEKKESQKFLKLVDRIILSYSSLFSLVTKCDNVTWLVSVIHLLCFNEQDQFCVTETTVLFYVSPFTPY